MRFPFLAPEGDVTDGGSGTGEGQTTVLEKGPVDWKTEIHPDYKDAKEWESIPDLKTLTKAYVDNARYNVGALKLPAQDAPPEEWAKVWEKLGKPSSPEGYALPERADEFMTAMRGVAHSAHLTPAQWQTLTDGYGRLAGEKTQAAQAEYEASQVALKQEWGAAYERKVGLIQRTIRQLGGDEALNAIVSKGLGNDVGFLKMLDKIAGALVEEEIIDGQLQGSVSLDEAKKEVEALTLSKEYLDASHPNHAAAVSRAQKLFELIYN